MAILLSRMCVVPTWFVVMGLVALSSPPIALLRAQRMWPGARHDGAALGVDGDAQDLMRMDSDKG